MEISSRSVWFDSGDLSLYSKLKPSKHLFESLRNDRRELGEGVGEQNAIGILENENISRLEDNNIGK
jgi:hypothetical protein